MLFEDDKEVHFMKYSIKGTSFFKYKMIATLIFNFSMKSFAWGWQVFVNLTTNKRNFAKRIWHFPLLFRELNIRNGRGQILENENLSKYIKRQTGAIGMLGKQSFFFLYLQYLSFIFFFQCISCHRIFYSGQCAYLYVQQLYYIPGYLVTQSISRLGRCSLNSQT